MLPPGHYDRGVPDCLFCGIAAGTIPATIVLDEKRVIAFRDITPQAPTHVLVIPKRHAAHLGEFVAQAQSDEIGRLFALASKVGTDAGGGGYRVVVNEGKDGGQTVFHLHLHVLAGRRMHWAPG